MALLLLLLQLLQITYMALLLLLLIVLATAAAKTLVSPAGDIEFRFTVVDAEQVRQIVTSPQVQDAFFQTARITCYDTTSEMLDNFLSNRTYLEQEQGTPGEKKLPLTGLVSRDCPGPVDGSSYRGWVSMIGGSPESISQLNVVRAKQLGSEHFEGLTGVKMLEIRESLTRIDSRLLSTLTELEVFSYYGVPSTMQPVLVQVHKDAFKKNQKLTKLSLHYTDTDTLDIFRGLTLLTDLKLVKGSLTSLKADIFDDLSSLRLLSLEENKLSTLPANIFNKLPDLEHLSLLRNPFSELPKDLLKHNTRLTSFQGNSMNLSLMPDGLFVSTTRMTTCRLVGNKLKSLPSSLLQLTSLKMLALSENQLTNLAIKDNNWTSMEVLELRNNKLTSPITHIFKPSSNKLREIKLGGNNITEFEEAWSRQFSALGLDCTTTSFCTALDLSRNQIGEQLHHKDFNFSRDITVSFEGNTIRRLVLPASEAPCDHKITIKLRNNQIVCDCHAVKVKKALGKRKGKTNACINVRGLDDYTCSNHNNKLLGSVKDERLTCFLDCTDLIADDDLKTRFTQDDCSTTETSTAGHMDKTNWIRGEKQRSDSTIKMLATNKNITRLEGFLHPENRNTINHLDLSHNQISKIDVGHLPKTLTTLHLHNNQIESFSEGMISYLTGVQKLKLGNNPYRCRCDSLPFIKFIKNFASRIEDKDNIQFHCPGAVLTMTSEDLESTVCPALLEELLLSLLGSACLVLLLLLCLLAWDRRGLLLCLNALPCLASFYPEDWSLPYDVFISYSHHDSTFVENTLWQHLENGCQPAYKYILHAISRFIFKIYYSQLEKSSLKKRFLFDIFQKEG